MEQSDYLAEIRQVLQWIKDDAEFRELFFSNPEEALDRLVNSGYVISERAGRFLLRRVNKDTFEDEYDRQVSGPVVRGDQAAPPSLPLPPVTGDRARGAVAANGGGRKPPKPPERIVSTGFASERRPAQSLDKTRPLAVDRAYYFWFQVGERVEGSIEVFDAELPVEKLPPEARLHVALFSFPGQLIITPGSDVGEIKIMPDGTVRVVKTVAVPDELDDDELLDKRLFFSVRTPPQPGEHQMRCNIYYQQTLVQSRLITVQVGPVPTPSEEPMLASEMDYTLSKVLDGNQLQAMGENLLSLMLNDNGDGTHGFRFFGQNEFKNDASLGEGALTNLVQVARGAMRRAAWGDKEPFKAGKSYRYSDDLDDKKLLNDLIYMAIRGKRFYDALINQIAGDADRAWDLEDLMAKPGQVQLASKESARLIVPIAMFYDYRLDDGAPNQQFSLCGSFKDALAGDEPLEDTACFQGDCPTRNDDLVVCPSGFWGFRHSIGLPVSVQAAPDAPLEIASDGAPKMAVSVSTDPAFTRRPQHEQALQGMGLGWEYADSRDESLEMLKNTDSQVVYFYCHGGLTSEQFPYLSVGPRDGKRFTRSNLRDWRIRWRKVRPLVFINGCHTTSLTPEAAIDLVSGFVETSHAAGVIGTEITNFEPLAAAFAEECFRRFLIERQSIGEAVRGARLNLLKQGNPLGVIYIPYALPGLKVV
jgi:hypothetical protein